MKNVINKIHNRISSIIDRFFNKNILYPSGISFLREGNYKKDENYENISNVWDECSKEINRIFFDENHNFFKSDIVKLHLAMPQTPLGLQIHKLLSSDAYGQKLLNLIQDSPLGSPELLKKYPLLSTTTLTHIANIYSIYSELGYSSTSKINILEFGGGYGGLGRAILNCNKNNRVTIIDIPRMLEIQNSYINKTSSNSENASYINIDQLPIDKSFDVFNATFSLSESPVYVRKKITNYIKTNVDSFFIVFQSNFDGHDNEALFKEFTNELSDLFRIEKKLYKWYAPRNDAFLLTGKKFNK